MEKTILSSMPLNFSEDSCTCSQSLLFRTADGNYITVVLAQQFMVIRQTEKLIQNCFTLAHTRFLVMEVGVTGKAVSPRVPKPSPLATVVVTMLRLHHELKPPRLR